MKRKVNLIIFFIITTLVVTFSFKRNVIVKAYDDYSSVLEADLSQDDINLMHEDNWLNQYVADNCSTTIDNLTLDNFKTITTIDKANSNLTTLPSSIKFCSNIQSLLIYGNDISIIPKEIGCLKNLEILKIGYKLKGNPLTEIPEEIGNLTKLQYLYIDSCKLLSLPNNIANLTSLQALSIRYNQVTNVPSCIFELGKNAQSTVNISLDYNQIIKMEDLTGEYPNLNLSVRYNYLTSVPSINCYQLLTEGNFLPSCGEIQQQLDFNNTDDISLKVGEKIDIESILITSFESGKQTMGENILNDMRVVADDTTIVDEYGNVLKEGSTSFKVKFTENPDDNPNGITENSVTLIATSETTNMQKQENVNLTFSQPNTIELLLSDNCIDFGDINGLIETPSKELEISVKSSLNYNLKMQTLGVLSKENDEEYTIPISKIKYSFQDAEYISLTNNEIILASNEPFTSDVFKKYKLSFKIGATIGYKAGKYNIPISIIVIQE